MAKKESVSAFRSDLHALVRMYAYRLSNHSRKYYKNKMNIETKQYRDSVHLPKVWMPLSECLIMHIQTGTNAKPSVSLHLHSSLFLENVNAKIQQTWRKIMRDSKVHQFKYEMEITSSIPEGFFG